MFIDTVVTLLFLKIHFQNDVSTIERSVIIDENLLCKAFYKQTNQIRLNYHVVRDIRSLENIFHEVDIFEINQNEQANLSSTSIKYHFENAVHNITSAIDLLEPKNPEFDFEMEKETMRIRLNFLLDQLKYLIVDKHGRRYTILTQVILSSPGNKVYNALYLYCVGHQLNLVCQDSCKDVQFVSPALEHDNGIINYVRGSAKRIDKFKQLVDEMPMSATTSDITLRPLCPTRWLLRLVSLESFLSNYNTLLDFMETQIHDFNLKPETRDSATTYLSILETFLTYFCCRIVRHLFAIIN